jgi:hypothetical protein
MIGAHDRSGPPCHSVIEDGRFKDRHIEKRPSGRFFLAGIHISET